MYSEAEISGSESAGSMSDRAVAHGGQSSRAMGKMPSRFTQSSSDGRPSEPIVQGRAKAVETAELGHQAPVATMGRRESSTSGADQIQYMYETDGSAGSGARPSDALTDTDMVEAGEKQHTSGVDHPVSRRRYKKRDPAHAQRNRNRPYVNIGPSEQAKRDEIIAQIRANWPHAGWLLWPNTGRLAPRSSDITSTEPLEPRDVSTQFLKAVLQLSLATKGRHLDAFTAMTKAATKRSKQEKVEERILKADVETARKVVMAKQQAVASRAAAQSAQASVSPISIMQATSGAGPSRLAANNTAQSSPIGVMGGRAFDADAAFMQTIATLRAQFPGHEVSITLKL